MSRCAAVGAMLALSVLAAQPRSALAEGAQPAAPAPSAAPLPVPVAPPRAEGRGVIVVAIGEAGPAARALAMEVYRDGELRPPIDEATARVLAGDAPAPAAVARLKEIAELRASVARAPEDLVRRRLLASIGTDLGAAMVVTVTLDAGRPVARALRSTGALLERVELGSTIETAADGAKTYRWPGATTTLRTLLGVVDQPAEPLRPVAPKAPLPKAPDEPRPFYKSPWFWGTAGAVVAAGITVLVLSRTSNGPADVHLTGRIGP